MPRRSSKTEEIERKRRIKDIKKKYNKPGFADVPAKRRTSELIDIQPLMVGRKRRDKTCPFCNGTGFVKIKGNENEKS